MSHIAIATNSKLYLAKGSKAPSDGEDLDLSVEGNAKAIGSVAAFQFRWNQEVHESRHIGETMRGDVYGGHQFITVEALIGGLSNAEILKDLINGTDGGVNSVDRLKSCHLILQVDPRKSATGTASASFRYHFSDCILSDMSFGLEAAKRGQSRLLFSAKNFWVIDKTKAK